ncbi:MAG: hypothetical protein MZU91_12235 [Desulfosudis oleivorans]|nr:hypothetical protein [Desulfosudis oleivorans]
MEDGKAALATNLVRRSWLRFARSSMCYGHGERVLPEWIYYFVRDARPFRLEAKRNFTGTAGQQRVPASSWRRTVIPVPPLQEQRRIVDLLARAEGILRLRREAQQKAAELIPAIFIDMFGDPAVNPKGWPVDALRHCAQGCGLWQQHKGQLVRPWPAGHPHGQCHLCRRSGCVGTEACRADRG